VRHRHRFGPWLLHKSGKHEDLPDKEFVSATDFDPFWVQSCTCGHQHWYRSRTRPLASMKFREMWGVRHF
jgi:hypothetical protein